MFGYLMHDGTEWNKTEWFGVELNKVIILLFGYFNHGMEEKACPIPLLAIKVRYWMECM